MEGNLPSNKNQELNIRQSFLHLNNSNSKACVKIFFWKYLTALSTSNYKKCNIYISFKQKQHIFSMSKNYVSKCLWISRSPQKTRILL